LDTSYLFPYVGLDLEENGASKWNLADLSKLVKSSNELLYCDLSLFEIYAKSLKLVMTGKLGLELDEIQARLVALAKSPRFQKVDYLPQLLEHEILEEMRRLHSDTLDVIFLYIAASVADCFVTMDNTLNHRLGMAQFFQNWITGRNPRFTILVDQYDFEEIKLNEKLKK